MGEKNYEWIVNDIPMVSQYIDGLKLVGGWPTPLKNDGVKVSWDDDIPNILWKYKNDPNHQAVKTCRTILTSIFRW